MWNKLVKELQTFLIFRFQLFWIAFWLSHHQYSAFPRGVFVLCFKKNQEPQVQSFKNRFAITPAPLLSMMLFPGTPYKLKIKFKKFIRYTYIPKHDSLALKIQYRNLLFIFVILWLSGSCGWLLLPSI